MAIVRDGEWSLWDYDFKTGIQKWVKWDEAGNMVMRTDFPHDATLDTNAEARAIAGDKWAGDWHHVASVPLPIFHTSGLAEAQMHDDQAFVSRWLNCSDNRGWRTKGGRV